MKKKIFCLFISLMFIITTMLTGCSGNKNMETSSTETGSGENKNTDIDRSPMTLSLWLPTDETTTDDAVKQVEEAISKITQAKFQTKIELHAISSEDYQSAIDNKLKDISKVQDDAKKNAQLLKEQEKELAKQGIAVTENAESTDTSTETDIETYVDDQGQTLTLYPKVSDDQLDIFLIKGYDNYKKYIDSEAIQILDSEITGNSKLLNTYIYPTFLQCANQSGTYAIPNNHAIGEYQFLLINKDLVEKYDYDIDELQSLTDCEDFIIDIGSMNLDGVVPLLGECDAGNQVYFSSDGKWSVLGDRITADYTYNTKIELGSSILDIPEVSNTIEMMKHLKELNYIGDGTVSNNEKFAVGVIKGDASVKEQYEDDYYVQIHAVPYADEDDIFESMFAVSSYSKNLARSMEIITYLNTNKDLRTILQYGVEGVHWEIDKDNSEEEVIKILNDDYKMNLIDTGNVFMTYPDEGVSMEYWENAKKQNLDSAVNPYMGFEYITESNSSAFKSLAQFSSKIKSQIDDMSYEEYNSDKATIKRNILTNEIFAALVSSEASDTVEETFAMLYDMYFSMKK